MLHSIVPHNLVVLWRGRTSGHDRVPVQAYALICIMCITIVSVYVVILRNAKGVMQWFFTNMNSFPFDYFSEDYFLSNHSSNLDHSLAKTQHTAAHTFADCATCIDVYRCKLPQPSFGFTCYNCTQDPTTSSNNHCLKMAPIQFIIMVVIIIEINLIS